MPAVRACFRQYRRSVNRAGFCRGRLRDYDEERVRSEVGVDRRVNVRLSVGQATRARAGGGGRRNGR